MMKNLNIYKADKSTHAFWFLTSFDYEYFTPANI